ncbi:MAG: coenzyme F420-0:L-glutamate ligase [Candidatus Thorarchaeota archaeon]|jgi:coenzyme F420-0:L-glutamate ligase/coenzyme F420-1:gamma-L-glutamate ligase
MRRREITIVPIREVPLVKPGDDLPSILVSSLERNGIAPQEGDVVVVTHAVVSSAEGNLHEISKIVPSQHAERIAEKTGRSPSLVELALQEASEIIHEDPVLITRTRLGLITDFSGIDSSNAPQGFLMTLPNDPDESALRIHDRISSHFGFSVPVIISDTQGRPWRSGAVNLAIGLAGMSAFHSSRGDVDLFGRELRSSTVCVADELASAAELVMGQSGEGIPFVLISGYIPQLGDSQAQDILRSTDDSLFG